MELQKLIFYPCFLSCSGPIYLWSPTPFSHNVYLGDCILNTCNLLSDLYKGLQLIVSLSIKEDVECSFWTTLWLLRLCGLSMNEIHFVLQDGQLTRVDDKMLWFKGMCLGVKITRGRFWWLILIDSLKLLCFSARYFGTVVIKLAGTSIVVVILTRTIQ